VRWVALLLFLLLLIGTATWYQLQPKTSQQMFEVRCSTCHELRDRKLCEFPAEERPAVVRAMRTLHGADKVIDDDEAKIIIRYIREQLPCR